MNSLGERDPSNSFLMRIVEARDDALGRGMSERSVSRLLFSFAVHLLHRACGRSRTLELLREAAQDVEDGTVQATLERDRFALRSSSDAIDEHPRLEGKSLTEKMEPLNREMTDALHIDQNAGNSGRAARAFWSIAECIVTETFGIIGVAEGMIRHHNSDDQILVALKNAEHDIERGVRTLALLLAAPKMHESLCAEFQEAGIVHPFQSQLGFRVRNDPKLSKKLHRFIDEKQRQGKSLAQIQRASRRFLKQLDQSN